MIPGGKYRHGEWRWREFALATLGFTFYRLYISIFFVSNHVLPQPQATMANSAYDAYSFLLAFLVASVALVRRPAFFRSDIAAVLGAACMALGALSYAALSVGGWGELAGPFAICASVGVALMTVQWGCALGVRWREEGLFSIIAGFFLAAVLNTGAGLFAPAYQGLAALAGPASCLALMKLRRCRVASEGSLAQRAGSDVRAGGAERVEAGFIARASVAFLLFAVASVFCSMPMEFSVIGGASESDRLLLLLRTCVTAAVCLVALGLAVLPRTSLRSIYRLIPLFLVIGGLSAFLQELSPLVAYACALVGRLGFQLVFWLFAPRIACCSKTPAGRVFAVEFALYWFGYAGSLFVVRHLWPDPYHVSVDAMGSMVVAAIVILLVSYLFVLPEHDLRVATGEALPDADGASAPASDGRGAAGAVADDGELAAMAERYGLSPRETEVFLLLARGRDTAYIQKSLFISAGTVSSHRRRIYQKMGVHTKQELLDLVEAGAV